MTVSTNLPTTMTAEEMVALSKRHTIYEWSAQGAVDPIPVARAKGVYFWTPDGKRFLDFNSQLMCVNIGHGDERVIRAIQEQAATLAYANPFMATEARARLGAKLAAICPGDIDSFFFTNGGADANENAIKMARWYTGRHKILARYRSYHGGTAGAITLTGDPRRWAAEPGIRGVVHVPDFYHGIQRGSDTTAEALARLEEVIELEGPQTIAAFIIEPVTGTNGILIPPDGYLEGLRALCDRHGILLIADEVMSGFGRTGAWFAIDHWKRRARHPDHGQGADERLRAAGCGRPAPADRRLLRRSRLRRRPDLQQPSAGLRGGARHDWRLRGGSADRSRAADRRADGGAPRGSGGAPPVGGRGPLDRPLRDRRAGAEPRHPRSRWRPSTAAPPEMAALGKFFRQEGLYTFVRWNTFFTNPPLTITEAELREGFVIIDRGLAACDAAVEG